jgi:hypothetical protein
MWTLQLFRVSASVGAFPHTPCTYNGQPGLQHLSNTVLTLVGRTPLGRQTSHFRAQQLEFSAVRLRLADDEEMVEVDLADDEEMAEEDLADDEEMAEEDLADDEEMADEDLADDEEMAEEDLADEEEMADDEEMAIGVTGLGVDEEMASLSSSSKPRRADDEEMVEEASLNSFSKRRGAVFLGVSSTPTVRSGSWALPYTYTHTHIHTYTHTHICTYT